MLKKGFYGQKKAIPSVPIVGVKKPLSEEAEEVKNDIFATNVRLPFLSIMAAKILHSGFSTWMLRHLGH